MMVERKSAAALHSRVPPNWYFASIRHNPLQRYWHKTRFKEVRKLIEPSGGTILDIGSADGMFTKVILDKSKAKKVVGVDVLKTSVDWANKHWKKNSRLSFKVGDAHKLTFRQGTFDAVFALEVLEHVYEPDKVLKEVRRVLKKGGYLVVLVPTDNLLFRFIWYLVTHFWRMRIWDDCHVQSFQKDSLVDIGKSVGFTVETNHKFLLGMLQAIKFRK